MVRLGLKILKCRKKHPKVCAKVSKILQGNTCVRVFFNRVAGYQKTFWCSQGDQNGILGRKGLINSLTIHFITDLKWFSRKGVIRDMSKEKLLQNVCLETMWQRRWHTLFCKIVGGFILQIFIFQYWIFWGASHPLSICLITIGESPRNTPSLLPIIFE